MNSSREEYDGPPLLPSLLERRYESEFDVAQLEEAFESRPRTVAVSRCYYPLFLLSH